MMTSQHIIDVSETNFQEEVLQYSHQAPVVVDFWAEWCGPCRMLGPALEKLAIEADGAFRLAKVNVDANPRLAQQFNVRSIPAVKAFRDGKVVSEFVGAQPEPRLLQFLQQITPDPHSLTLERGESLLDELEAAEAERSFRQVLAVVHEHPRALLGLSRSLLLQGRGAEAAGILAAFPASPEYQSAQLMLPLAQALQQYEQGSLPSDDDLDPLFSNSLRLVKRGNLEAAMDGLLEILRQNRAYRGGTARKAMLGILEAMGNQNPVTRQYRTELASVLF